MSDLSPSIDTHANPDPRHAAELLPLVYSELRRVAAAKLMNESPNHTLSATALVHEAFLKLGGDRSFASRSGFLRAAAESMRRILIDHARAKRADKRGGDRFRIPMDLAFICEKSADQLLELDELLLRFAKIEPRKAELVNLRFFAGLTIPEAAAALEVSESMAERWWTFSRTWLYAELQEQKK